MSATPNRGPVGQGLSRAVGAAVEVAGEAAESALDYLGSERGRELRRKVATAVIIAAPILSELPVIRRSPLGRLMRTAAVGAILIRGAEWLRDWEPASQTVRPR